MNFTLAFWIALFTAPIIASFAVAIAWYVRNTIEFITVSVFITMLLWSLLFLVLLSNFEVWFGGA